MSPNKDKLKSKTKYPITSIILTKTKEVAYLKSSWRNTDIIFKEVTLRLIFQQKLQKSEDNDILKVLKKITVNIQFNTHVKIFCKNKYKNEGISRQIKTDIHPEQN